VQTALYPIAKAILPICLHVSFLTQGILDVFMIHPKFHNVPSNNCSDVPTCEGKHVA